MTRDAEWKNGPLATHAQLNVLADAGKRLGGKDDRPRMARNEFGEPRKIKPLKFFTRR